jgi:hypothetical protein
MNNIHADCTNVDIIHPHCHTDGMKCISFTYLFAMLLADSQNKTALIKVRGSLTSVGKEINICG